MMRVIFVAMANVLFNGVIPMSDGKEHHLVVSQPLGGGGVYYVYIDNYFVGQLTKMAKEWQSYLNTDLLYSEDVQALLDRVE